MSFVVDAKKVSAVLKITATKKVSDQCHIPSVAFGSVVSLVCVKKKLHIEYSENAYSLVIPILHQFI